VADDFVLVEEAEIEEAITWAARELDEVVEPSGAAALAGCFKHAGSGYSVVVLSGGNIDPVLFRRLTGRRDGTADESRNPSRFP
jgi:threonine dehydratase